jgi:hypothetical protein
MNSLSKLLLNKKTEVRLEWLYLLTSIGLLAGILISLSAWSGIRTYPLVPVFSHLTLPAWAQTFLILTLVTSTLIGMRYKTYRSVSLGISLLSLFTLCLLDITRFQPWIFHYGAILSIYLIGTLRNLSHTRLLDAARILIAGIYFWSGVQKINWAFMSVMFPWFTQPIWELAPAFLLPAFLTLGLVVPFLEIAIAFGLLFKPSRKWAILGAAGMLLLVLICLGPLGHNWNSVVWPWNIVMFLTVLVLFWDTSWTFKDLISRQKNNLVGLAVFVLFWLLPIGNMFGVVDHYMSWSLYSGRPAEATLTGDHIILSSLSADANDETLPFLNWSLGELRVVPYPEERVFMSIFKSVCTTYDNDPSLELEIKKSFSYWQPRKIVRTENCSSVYKKMQKRR